MQYGFGTGSLILVPGGANPTPQQVGVLQEVSLDISMTSKQLRGGLLFPVDIATSEGKISGKAKHGAIQGGLIAAVLAGATRTPNASVQGTTETSAIPTTPNTITVTQSAKWSDDMGVMDLTSGIQMARVASAPATGQYSVAAGVYSFASADASHQVAISYRYTATSGATLSFQNPLIGNSTTFQLHLFNTSRGKSFGLKLYAVTVPKISLAWKNEDYTTDDIEFEAFADATGNVIDIYTAD